jgi:cysteinyl-tRNA synthetase
MQPQLYIQNSLTRKKELFEPYNPPHVGMYVCGPTVYGDPHLGHARPAITFDLVFRWLGHLGYRVRYVRNITDVGHLEGDADSGDDKIGKKARLEQLEPMEVVQHYTNRYHNAMNRLNVLPPSIEPHATGHITEQIEMIRKILESGYAYEVNGSIYFDVDKYNNDHQYGILSGRKTDELLTYTRELGGQEEKRSSFDFALWKKSTPGHLMHWPSPWGEGYPGWHLECSTMGTRYLGEQFDIHGGGMDLLFPHHECEIAQSVAANGKQPVKYWMHNNMITLNGQKMGKSLGNAVSLFEFFSGDNPLLEKAYGPMTIRFFILQAHYRSTLDFSNEALQASEKGLKKLMGAMETVGSWQLAVGNESRQSSVVGHQSEEKWNVGEFRRACYDAMNDDFNSPVMIARLFDAVRVINLINEGKMGLTPEDAGILKETFEAMMTDILGLMEEDRVKTDERLVNGLMDTILAMRKKARENKDFATSDKIRDELEKINIRIKDTKDGAVWEKF